MIKRRSSDSSDCLLAKRCVDGPGHQDNALGLRRVIVFRHQRRGCEGRRTRLAHCEQVRVWTDRSHELDHVLDILVEPEAPGRDRDVTSVVPVSDEHLVVG